MLKSGKLMIVLPAETQQNLHAIFNGDLIGKLTKPFKYFNGFLYFIHIQYTQYKIAPTRRSGQSKTKMSVFIFGKNLVGTWKPHNPIGASASTFQQSPYINGGTNPSAVHSIAHLGSTVNGWGEKSE